MTRVRVTPLGGVGRFGRNCALLEVEGGAALVIDCGARFVSEDEAPGFDVALPDLSRIEALGDRLLAYVVTHGHEDHIGALPWASRVNNKPIVTTPYTARLIARRYDRNGDKLPEIRASAPPFSTTLGPFSVRFLAVSHSIPDASCVVIDTPAGRVVHSGDFRVDDDPLVGPPTDLAGLERAGDDGVALLLADSTGAHLEGKNAGERSVWPALLASVEGAQGRVIISCFASHIQRLTLIAALARETGRKMALLGRGLVEHNRIASDLGLLSIDDVLIKDERAKKLPLHEQLWVVTGSQGEPGAALARLANGTGAFSVERGDRVVLSARTIPGNDLKLARMLDALAERGADIVDGQRAPHVSGHGTRADLEALMLAVRPRHFAPLHGDARHLLAHEALVMGLGLDPARVHNVREGSSLVVEDGTVTLTPAARAAEPLAAYGAMTTDASATIAARKRMSGAGVLVVQQRGDGIALVPRGVFPPLDAELANAVRALAPDALRKRGTPEEDEALRPLVSLFFKRGRPPPELVLLGDLADDAS
jgi:ribonuclease J